MREKKPNPGLSAFGETSPVGGPAGEVLPSTGDVAPAGDGGPSAQASAGTQPESVQDKAIAQPRPRRAQVPAGAANVTPVVEQPLPASTSKVNDQELQETEQPAGEQVHKSKLSILQIALMAGIVCSTALLTYSLVRSSRYSSPLQAKAEDVVQVSEANKSSAEQGKTEVSSIKRGDSTDSRTDSQKDSRTAEESAEPLSLQIAENHYEAKDYDGAYNVYERLRQNLSGPDYEMTRDFLLLKMGLCLERKGEYDNANQLFRKASLSRSVVAGVFANYHSSLMEQRLGQYLNARTRAYKTLALTGALASDYEWTSTLERDCAFIVAEAITRQVLMLCDADSQLPQQLWSQESGQYAASLTGTETALTELTGLKTGSPEELQKTLNAGVEKLNKGLLTPQIRAIEQGSANSLNRWQVCCDGPGIDELIARFAANASLDVKWIRPENSVPAGGNNAKNKSAPAEAKWNRSVTLYLPSATTQQVVATAAGAVGLLAQVDNIGLTAEDSPRAVKGTITITDPAEYSSLSEHTKMLAEHAIWLWRKLLLMYGDDRRMADAHFALGVLEGQSGRVAEAIAEYKLVTTRYSQTALAPFALLRSSRLKTALRDYAGASRDLKELIEQYPDNELVGQAHLELAETTMKAGLFEQACSLYRKAYNLGFSTEFTAAAALGAGKSYYQMKDYESAKKWLTRYLETVQGQKPDAKHDSRNADSYTAYFLLGKSYLALGNLEAACSALQRTATLAVAGDDYFDALTALVETQIKQNNFIEALAIIENVRDRPLSQGQSTQLLILKSRALRGMGLADQALTLLSDRERYVADSQLKASIIIEIARCNTSNGKFDLAKEYLTEGLSLLAAGPEAQQVSIELAEVCLKLGENQQVISICSQLIDSSQSREGHQTADESIKRQASGILASAYNKQQDYDKAAQILLMASKSK